MSSVLLICLITLFCCKFTLAYQCTACIPMALCPGAQRLVNSKDHNAIQKLLDSFCGRDWIDKKWYNKVWCSNFSTEEPDVRSRHPNVRLLPNSVGNGLIRVFATWTWNSFDVAASYTDRKYEYQCQGTFINSKYLVTAAHCVHINLTQITLRQRQGPASVKTGYIEKKIIYPGFRRFPYMVNDIALLRINTSLTYESTKFMARLPLSKFKPNFTELENTKVFGWKCLDRDPRIPYLHAVHILSDINCTDKYYRNFKSDINEGPNKRICVEGTDSKFCFGNGGDPLVRRMYNKTWLYGISSHSLQQCGSSPYLFTDIRKYSRWILNNIEA